MFPNILTPLTMHAHHSNPLPHIQSASASESEVKQTDIPLFTLTTMYLKPQPKIKHEKGCTLLILGPNMWHTPMKIFISIVLLIVCSTKVSDMQRTRKCELTIIYSIYCMANADSVTTTKRLFSHRIQIMG